VRLGCWRSAVSDLFDRYRVIDVDTHVSEPPDLWTSRVASRWVDAAPHVERRDRGDVWVMNGNVVSVPGVTCLAGYDGSPPDEYPRTFEELLPSCHDPEARLAHLDAEGIFAEVLYPNVGGFGSQAFLKLGEPELMLECVRAYNDFITEWASIAPNRLLAVTALPYWDVQASIAEIRRGADLGHRSILFPSQPQDFDQPPLSDPHWDPVWAAAQEVGLPISFHIGGQDSLALRGVEAARNREVIGTKAFFSRLSVLAFVGNALGITEIIFGGVCHRFPKLNFVSVESGVGWVPPLIEMCDWQWSNANGFKEHPDYLTPSEYFRRQIYACFWFERDMVARAVELYPDNILYETDFPHPTSQSPGPATIAQHPRVYAEEVLGTLPEAHARKVLQDNAARVYGVT
jgi:predicted TIM-barrel fold metal-dependent hydrolase